MATTKATALGHRNPASISDQANTSTGYLDLPAGTTAQRPTLDNAGGTRFNTTTGSLEFYDGTNWVSTNLIPTITSITGTIYAGASSTLTLLVSSTTDTIDVKYYESGSLIATDSGLTVTNGSTTSTVPSAVYGQTAGDTISIQVLNQDGTPSSNNIDKTVIGLPTGGNVTTSGGYYYHKFTSSGNFVVPSGFSASAEYILIAGGGAGGTDNSGGGGAGGLVDSSTTLSAQTYSINIGGGAPANPTLNTQSSSGTDSTAFGSTAIKGGYGGTGDPGLYNGGSGGSGGGGASESGNHGTGGSGTSGQGNAGGNSSNGGGGGGGGAGSAGQAGNVRGSTLGGNGGAGLDYSTWATATSSGDSGYYAGGGGGGNDNGVNNNSSGGAGGGGDGTFGTTNTSPANAQINTGGGGGGGTYDAGNIYGGSGGSGICLVRYQLP
jgi:hypothetical protein